MCSNFQMCLDLHITQNACNRVGCEKRLPQGYLSKLIIGHFLESPIAPNKMLYTYHQQVSCIPSLSHLLFLKIQCVSGHGARGHVFLYTCHSMHMEVTCENQSSFLPCESQEIELLCIRNRFVFSWQKLASTDEKVHEYLKDVTIWLTTPLPWPRLLTPRAGPLVTTLSWEPLLPYRRSASFPSFNLSPVIKILSKTHPPVVPETSVPSFSLEKLLAWDVSGGPGFSSTLAPQITAHFNGEGLH